jgi:site-specific recombinase XerD
MQSRISMNENMPLKSSTISNYLKCINLFFKYLSDRQILEGTIIFPRKIINEDVEQKFITIEELKLIFEQCSSEREKAILSLAYGCGLRKSEIQNLNVEDFYYQASIIVIKMGKGQLRREVPLSDNVKEQLKKYIYEERSLYILEHNRLENAFILNNRGGRMTGEHLGVHLKNLILKTENETLINKKITLHSLRHSIAIHLIDHGATIEFVKNFLGHKDIDTTQLYARRRKRKTILMRAIHFD